MMTQKLWAKDKELNTGDLFPNYFNSYAKYFDFNHQLQLPTIK